jgi:hypothetical protein
MASCRCLEVSVCQIHGLIRRNERKRLLSRCMRVKYVKYAHFLTLCAGVDYTIKFDTCPLCGLTVALCLQGETAAVLKSVATQ